MLNVKNIYKKNPYIYLPLRRFIKSRAYISALELFNTSEKWSASEIDAWQFSQVKNIVEYAFDHVPYYHNLYKEAGYIQGDLESWREFEKLPYIEKNHVKNNLSLFTSDEISKIKHTICHTGGSTDKPMEFYQDKEIMERESAFFNYYWSKYGYNSGERCVILRGHNVADINKKRFYEYDKIRNYKVFDSKYITKIEYLPFYDKQIKDFHARVLQAYPSSLYNFAKTYKESGINPPKFDLIFLGSENTYNDQIDFIKDVFCAKRVIYHYGFTECAAIALKYADCNRLGFFPQYGRTELIDENGQQVKTADGLGEIVATTFSKSTPFIRYKTEDCAISSDYKSNDFMHNCLAVERIEGRLHEFIVTMDSRLVSLCTVAGAHMPSLSEVGDMQYEQQQKGRLIIKVTSKNGTNISTITYENIKRDFRAVFADSLEVEIHQIESLERTDRGKKILLNQRINLDKIRNEK